MLPIIKLKKPVQRFNAKNSMLRIIINPELRHFRAIMAQEYFEFCYKWAYLRGFLTPFIDSIYRKMEIKGHEVEVQWAVMFDGVNESDYRMSEAKALHKYKRFDKIQVGDIVSLMVDEKFYARKWIQKNFDKVISLDKRG